MLLLLQLVRFGALQFGTGGVDVTYVNFQYKGDTA